MLFRKGEIEIFIEELKQKMMNIEIIYYKKKYSQPKDITRFHK